MATAGPAKHGFLRDLGALPVAYGPGLAGRVRAAAPGGVDAALDLIGTDEAVDVSLEAGRRPGHGSPPSPLPRAASEAGIKVLGGAPGADPGTQIRDAARLELARLAQEPGAAGLRDADLSARQGGRRPPRQHGRPHHREDRAHYPGAAR